VMIETVFCHDRFAPVHHTAPCCNHEDCNTKKVFFFQCFSLVGSGPASWKYLYRFVASREESYCSVASNNLLSCIYCMCHWAVGHQVCPYPA